MTRTWAVAAVLIGLAAGPGWAGGDKEDDGDRGDGRQHEDRGDAQRGFDQARVRIGYQIAPVPLNLAGKNRALVGLGSYIVNAQSACNDCHTHPEFAAGGSPFLGEAEVINAEQYLAGGRQFGPITSANITPDASGKPAGLTFEQFKAVMRTGHDPDDPNKILQVMPWHVYGKMIDRDLRAIYEYLRAIPSLPDNPNPGP